MKGENYSTKLNFQDTGRQKFLNVTSVMQFWARDLNRAKRISSEFQQESTSNQSRKYVV